MRFSIQSRVLALGGAGVFIAAGVFSLLSRASLLELDKQVGLQRAHLAHVVAGTVSAAVDDDLRVLATAAMAPHIDLADGDDAAERAALASIHHHGRIWSAVFFFDRHGALIVADPARDHDVMPPEASALAARAIAMQRPLFSDVVTDRTGRKRVLCLVPFGGVNAPGAGAAAFTVDVPSRAVGALLEAAQWDREIHIALTDEAGVVVASTPGPAPDDTRRVHAAIPGTPWSVSVVEIGPDPFAPIARFRQQSLWLAPAFTAFAMLLAWGIAHSVRRPLATLTASAERIARGDLDRPVDQRSSASGGDEIARLGAALEGMRASLKISMDQVEDANRALERRVAERTAELERVNVQLHERERMRQQLLRTVISAQEDERKRIARELHDETSQTLAALGMGLDTAIARSDVPEARQKLADARRLVDRMNAELHRLIVNLRPSVLDDLGLAAAIEWFAERHLAAAGIAVRCELGDLDVRLPSEMEAAVFRVVQEAINNIARHAHAESVLIQLSGEEGVLTVEIEDDGRGFDVASAADGPGSLRGVGLLGMRERIAILGGTLQIDSEPGEGTRILIKVPVTTAVGGSAPAVVTSS
jgi:signal transduction histidine kinase